MTSPNLGRSSVRESVPVVASGTTARTISGLWREARLRADDARSTSVRPASSAVSWRAAFEEILAVGYGQQTRCRFVAGAWEQVRWRTTPSAGALYPFEIVACVLGEGTYIWDAESGRLVPWRAALTEEDLAGAGLAITTGQRLRALLVVVARPWVSMKKYRQRGYQYCLLDVGHVTTNLAMYATAVGCAPTLHLRFCRARLAEHLRLAGLCREPAAVLSFAGAERAASHVPEFDVGSAAPMFTSLEPPSASELQNWELLSGIRAGDTPLESPSLPATTSLLAEPAIAGDGETVVLPECIEMPSTAADCRSAIVVRRSAKGFRDRPLTVRQIAALLGALRGEGLQGDCSRRGASRLGVRLVAANVDGLSGVYAYAPHRHALHRLDRRVDDVRSACMMQRVANGAAALLLFHAPEERLLEGYSPFVELHFHAAQLGQRLHLAAVALPGVGLTCIGGFDGERCAALTRLAPGDEAVYVILLGVPDESAFKDDRLRVAHSHGYTTEEG